eukprot:Lithocolla_globosa_v1_NODE_1228_length_2756_cov_44.691596.p5 type:complete len:119 gc:universal NODE_1228_length_2756_cov_44.691596:1709-1353(-)
MDKLCISECKIRWIRCNSVLIALKLRFKTSISCKPRSFDDKGRRTIVLGNGNAGNHLDVHLPLDKQSPLRHLWICTIAFFGSDIQCNDVVEKQCYVDVIVTIKNGSYLWIQIKNGMTM